LSTELKVQTRVVQKADNAIHRIDHYPEDSTVCFVETHLLVCDLSGGWCFPSFEQLGQGEIQRL